MMSLGGLLRFTCRFPVQILKSDLRNLSNMAAKSVGKGKFSGKVAIVTASTEGIGFAIAKRLAQDGASVVVSSRKENKVEQAVKELTAEGLDVCGTVCHVGKPEDRKRLVDFTVQKKGGIDILISNAATNPVMGPVLDVSEEAWDKIFDVNVKAALFLTKEVVPHMEKKGGGSIVYVSSVAAYTTFPVIAAYSVSKTALLGLAKAVALQLTSENIRVNCICPGIIKTSFSKALWESDASHEYVLQQIPLRRLGKPEECAGLVSFLCSEDASYITGESFPVTGGMYTRL